MKDLKCGLRSCKYNKGYCCNAKEILVGKKTDCTTYTQDPQNLSLFETGSDFITASYAVDTKVGCDADCVFNKDKKCIANGITVMSEEGLKAACLTFIRD